MSVLANSNAIESGGYQIAKSLRFRASNINYLSKTFSGDPSDLTKFTISMWVKLGQIPNNTILYAGGNSASSSSLIGFNPSSQLQFYTVNGGSVIADIRTNAVFRDPSAWYHIVITFDSANATAANRVLIYVNGVSQALTITTTQALSAGTFILRSFAQTIGRQSYTSTNQFDGYISEINAITGQALTPSSFGEISPETGQWVAKKYTGSYGTNGFYLPFDVGTSLTTLGQDRSGNGNNWTLTNHSLTAGVNYDWMDDTPTNNFCVLNPLNKESPITTSKGNLELTTNVATLGQITASFGMSSGKWYWEFTSSSGNNIEFIGIVNSLASLNTFTGGDANGWAYYRFNGQKYNNNSGVSYGSTWNNNDVIGVAFDADARELTFYINGVSQGVAFTGIAANTYFPSHGDGSGSAATSGDYNFGQRPFAYTPPTGFKALCTANLPIPTIKRGDTYFDAVTYTGNGTGQSISSLLYSPDLVWFKRRNTSENHWLVDTVRGVGNGIYSNLTNAEASQPTTITSFNSNGFTLGADVTGFTNGNGSTYVAWSWDAGSSTVSNTNGSITSQVRANPTAGFSVLTYTSQASGNATIGHGLGIAPSLLIIKPRTGTVNWAVYHQSIGNTNYLNLNSVGVVASSTTFWNSTSPTSTVFTQGTSFAGLGTMVAYCFAEIAGYSKIGSYVGNGSAEGTFIYCGGKPAYVLIKRTDSGVGWVIYDNERNKFNVVDSYLGAESASAESVLSGIDFVSNGFKARSTQAGLNASGGSYVYYVVLETAINYATAR